MNNTSKKQKWQNDFREIMGAIHELEDQFPHAEESFRNITALMDTNYDSFIEWMTEGEMDEHYGILDGCAEDGSDYEYRIDSQRAIVVFDSPQLEGDGTIKVLRGDTDVYLYLVNVESGTVHGDDISVRIIIDNDDYYISLVQLEEVIL